MEELVGYIHKIIYRNETNNYVVASLKLDQKKDEKVTIVGYFKVPSKLELYRYFGTFFSHPKFGRQFQVESLELITPNSKEAIIRFLSSSTFKGVGVKTATTVYDYFGDDCLSILRKNPEKINEVSISSNMKRTIIDGIYSNNLQNETIKLFIGSGISMKYIMKMDAIYGNKLMSVVMDNPYTLIKDIDGLSFNRVDEIAHQIGFKEDDPRRIKVFFIRTIKNICFKTKDSYVEKDVLLNKICSMFPSIDHEDIVSLYQDLKYDFELIEEDNRVYYKDIYEAEEGIANLISKYICNNQRKIKSDVLLELIQKVEESELIKYSNEQVKAIIQGINSKISIITGGPGTGKTTIVKAIVKIYELLNPDDRIIMLAPTGRASKRLGKLSSHSSKTIHSFLKWDLETSTFSKNENDPCVGEFMIIDEFSMVDIELFHALLKATQSFKKILIIGDDEQLPPVSIGNILKDFIDLKLINVTKLVYNYRQDVNSGIIPLCGNVINGLIDEDNLNKDDVKFIESNNSLCRNQVLKIVKQLIEEGYKENDIQVLSPMYDGASGIDSLNDVLRNYFNPESADKNEISITKTLYREGDRILQLKNDADNNVFNGDLGKLVKIEKDDDESTALYVDFDGNVVKYTSSDYQNISLGYCISVHKSQGSEYECVIMPFMKQHIIMLKRKLIYTGLSRAKKRLILIGEKSVLKNGVKIVETDNRKTTLGDRIKKNLIENKLN